MKSTIRTELKIIDGKIRIVPKEYPNWHGIPDIGLIWINEWADPYIEYNGKEINSVLIEEAMWEQFMVDTGSEDYDKFSAYMREHAEDLYELLEREA